jgi:hypothetical protein
LTKVKVDFSGAEKDFNNFKRIAAKALQQELKKEVIDSLNRGISPVKGEGRLVKYSDSYLEAIKKKRVYADDGRIVTTKKKRPVNLKLTGKLHESIFSYIRGNSIVLGFKNKLADIHNRLGAGKAGTIRRILPTKEGEVFSRSITTSLREVLEKIANRIFR